MRGRKWGTNEKADERVEGGVLKIQGREGWREGEWRRGGGWGGWEMAGTI
jgi:hypothetical protein